MITSILLKLKGGLRLTMGRNSDPRDTARLKVKVEDWVTSGVTIQLGNRRGEVMEIPPTAIEAVEMEIEKTPPTGLAVPVFRLRRSISSSHLDSPDAEKRGKSR